MIMEPGRRSASLSLAVLLAVYGWLCLSGTSADAITGAEVIEKARVRFGEFKTFSARFRKTFFWAALDQTLVRHGRMYLRRPNLFRVELEGGSVVVADGSAIWSYSQRNQQAVVGPYQGEFQTPWEVLLDYSTRYLPVAVEEVRLGKHRCYALALRSSGSHDEDVQMKVWVDRKHWYLRRVEQHEAGGNVTTYELSDFRVNKKLDDALFQFTPPADTEVIDRRPQAVPGG